MGNLSRVEYQAHGLLEAEAIMYKEPEITPTSYHGNDFHASSYIECGRKQVARLLRMEATPSESKIQWKRDAELGKVVHAYIQNLMVAAGHVLMIKKRPAIEVKLRDYISPEMRALAEEVHFVGSLDGILQSKVGDLWVWEGKSIDEEILNGKKQRYLADKLAHYETQVQMYMHFTEIHRGIILVVSRQRFFDLLMGRTGITWEECYQEFEVEYDPEFCEREIARLRVMAEHLKNKTLPEGEPGREGKSCRFCNYPCERRAK